MAFCKNCGTQLPEGAGFCTNCGASTGDAPVSAPVTPASAPNSSYLAGQDKTTMALICFFLGGLGIHNFMMGESKKGIFKIVMSFCFGIGAILALIDFVKILTDKYEVNPEKLV